MIGTIAKPVCVRSWDKNNNSNREILIQNLIELKSNKKKYVSSFLRHILTHFSQEWRLRENRPHTKLNESHDDQLKNEMWKLQKHKNRFCYCEIINTYAR